MAYLDHLGYLAVTRTVSRGAKRGTEGWATSRTAGSKSADGNLPRVVRVAAIHSHWFVGEGEDVFKEVDRAGVCVSWS